eukprot:gene33207-40974_t
MATAPQVLVISSMTSAQRAASVTFRTRPLPDSAPVSAATSASSMAMALPMPREAPVTSAT